MLIHDLSIRKYNMSKEELESPIYDNISSLDEAFLLAQYAMKNKANDELIVIMPGWNQELTNEEKERAIELAQKYNASSDKL